MRIAVDFDGVLIKRKNIDINKLKRPDDFFDDLPMSGALNAIRWLQKEGHEVYVFTAREEKWWIAIKNWLIRHKFPYLEITNIKKLYTKLYIDDRAIRFTNWDDICKLIG